MLNWYMSITEKGAHFQYYRAHRHRICLYVQTDGIGTDELCGIPNCHPNSGECIKLMSTTPNEVYAFLRTKYCVHSSTLTMIWRKKSGAIGNMITATRETESIY